ncbi:hypothetical protein CK556_00565 [Mesoplasma chauliocola]|uniref:Solute-binding protein family 5 domain-containing protein n=1 Tax=Mesoplasma chauliocola TaxID=216427 RepID=A0A249SMP1_9MOLU|nr:oligopeptide ABC transporter substrate-binding protein OppA [Mesoplasma chauliocola]ASZ08859.1 hypothetical protein CK556_00565 [Mesoplasma chauliocola]
MRKLLSIIAATTLIGTASSTLVSCGISKEKLMARKVNTKEYKGFLQSAINTWSPGSSNQSSDSLVLENLYDGLITPSSNSTTFEGQMADWWGHDEEGKNYYFHLRDKPQGTTGIPKWTKVRNGKILGTEDVKAMDFYNAFRFTFNPNSSADGAEPTNSLFKYGNDLSNFLTDISTYDQANHDSKYFGRTTSEGGTSNIGKEAVSTKYFDILVMLVNLWSGKEENSSEAQKLKSIFDVNLRDHEIKDASGATKYKPIPAFEEAIIEMQKYYANDKFNNLVIDSAENGGMMSVSETSKTIGSHEYNIRYTLDSPSTSFFQSAVGYGSMKPLPFFAVEHEGRGWYNFSKKYEPNASEMWYSGAYYVQSHQPTSNTVLVKNPNYFQADRTYIEKATYTLIRGSSVDSNRLWFEGGDATEVAISPNDDMGWKKYVGDDYNSDEQSFAFTGTHATSTIPSQYTFTTFYNYGRLNSNTEIRKSSLALAQKSVRFYLNYFMQRTQYPAYVAGKLDNDSNTKESLAWDGNNNVKTRNSTLLRNTFTLPRLAVNEDTESNVEAAAEINGVSTKDYTIQNIGGEYNKMYGIENPLLEDTNSTNSVENSQTRFDVLVNALDDKSDEDLMKEFYEEHFGSLTDGNDAFYQNDLMAISIFTDLNGNLKTGYEDLLKEFANEALATIKDINKYPNDASAQKNIDKQHEYKKGEILGKAVRKDLESKKIINTGEQIEIEWLLNGDSRMTLNPRVRYIIDQFNISVNNGQINGTQSPIRLKAVDTNDIEDYKAKSRAGEFDIYVSGWGPDYTDPYNFLQTLTFGGAYDVYTKMSSVISKVSESGAEMNSAFSSYKTAYDELATATFKYGVIAEQARLEGDLTKRLNLLGQAESNALYNYGLTTPLYNKTPIKTIMLSYIDPFTRSNYIAGSSNNRLFGVKMIESLWTKEEYLAAEKQFNLGVDAVGQKVEYTRLYTYDLTSNSVVKK